MNIDKLARGLALTIGKTVSRVFLLSHDSDAFHVYLCFTDGSHFEFYGKGSLGGATSPDFGEAEVRLIVERESRSSGYRSQEVA